MDSLAVLFFRFFSYISLVIMNVLPGWYISPYIKDETTPPRLKSWQLWLYMIALLPRTLLGLLYSTFLYLWIGIYLWLNPCSSTSKNGVRSRSSQHYMVYFITLLTLNFYRRNKACKYTVFQVLSRIFQSTKNLCQAYQLIMYVDDVFDDIDHRVSQIKTDKEKKLSDIFELILSHFEQRQAAPLNTELSDELCLSISDFLETLSLAEITADERESIKSVLERCKLAYLIEINSTTSDELWVVLRAQAFALTELCFIPAVYLAGANHIPAIQDQNRPLIRSVAHVMFMGNIADDWMDYYWTKEDINRRCYINSLLSNKELTNRHTLYKHICIFKYMLGRVSHEVGTHQYRSRIYGYLSWILPAQALLSLVTGPLNIFRWILLRR